MKANGFKFDENPGDDDKIKNALKDTKTLFRKIRLARVEASIRMVELKKGKSEAGTQQDEDLLTNLKRELKLTIKSWVKFTIKSYFVISCNKRF